MGGAMGEAVGGAVKEEWVEMCGKGVEWVEWWVGQKG